MYLGSVDCIQDCGVCCMLLSVWAVIQLFIMGIFFKMEVMTFIEEAEAHEYDSYSDFIDKTKENFASIAINCWVAAGIYLAFIFISYSCIRYAKNKRKKNEAKLQDEDAICRMKSDKLADALAAKID